MAVLADSGKAPYDVKFDDVDGHLRISVRGFWSLSEAAGFDKRLRDGVADARRRTSDLPILVDAREIAVHPASTVDELSDRDAAPYSRKDHIAVILSSLLARMQLKRFFNSATTRYFWTAEAAEQWLRGL